MNGRSISLLTMNTLNALPFIYLLKEDWIFYWKQNTLKPFAVLVYRFNLDSWLPAQSGHLIVLK